MANLKVKNGQSKRQQANMGKVMRDKKSTVKRQQARRAKNGQSKEEKGKLKMQKGQSKKGKRAKMGKQHTKVLQGHNGLTAGACARHKN